MSHINEIKIGLDKKLDIGTKLKRFDLKNKKEDGFITNQSSNFVNFYQKITGEQ